MKEIALKFISILFFAFNSRVYVTFMRDTRTITTKMVVKLIRIKIGRKEKKGSCVLLGEMLHLGLLKVSLGVVFLISSPCGGSNRVLFNLFPNLAGLS